MNNAELTQKLDGAKNRFGVITPQALHDQLGTFTPADWKNAAAMFSKNHSGPDGFYITDDASGKVTVHNDLRSAQKDAASPAGATIEDAKHLGTAALTVAGAVGAGAAGWGIYVGQQTAEAFSTYGFGIAGADVALTGLAAAGEVALAGAAVLGSVGVLAGTGDYARNLYDQSKAKDDVRTAANLTIQSR